MARRIANAGPISTSEGGLLFKVRILPGNHRPHRAVRAPAEAFGEDRLTHRWYLSGKVGSDASGETPWSAARSGALETSKLQHGGLDPWKSKVPERHVAHCRSSSKAPLRELRGRTPWLDCAVVIAVLRRMHIPRLMKKAILIGMAIFAVASAFLVWLSRRGNGDFSKVRLDLVGYDVTDGKRSLVLLVTNGSSYRISQPGRNVTLRGDAPGSRFMSSNSSMHWGCGSVNSGWGQLKMPNIPSVAPGETFRFAVPVMNGPYTWHVTVPFKTIPLRERLPYALRSRWPASKQNSGISFEVTSPAISPAESGTESAKAGAEF
jgi:hypothetical protein